MTEMRRVTGLDFVRGIAATLVMIQHSLEAAGRATGWLDPFHGIGNFGQAGVVAFFLVSGYVIPMSLEKTGSLRAFWISRFFRIYPMYFVSFFVTVLFLNGVLDFKTLVAHISFVQEFVPGVRSQVPNSWTLSLELVWYLATTGLFALGMLRRSHIILGLTLVAAAVVAVLSWQTTAFPTGRFSMLISCVIGLLFYRHVTGQSQERYRLVILVAVVFSLIFLQYRLENGEPRDSFSPWTVLAAWAVGYIIFSVGLLYGAKFPCRGVLAWLGRISFSSYLIHPFMVHLAHWFGIADLPIMLFVILSTTVLSTLTYYHIELPAIRYGQRLISRSPDRA